MGQYFYITGPGTQFVRPVNTSGHSFNQKNQIFLCTLCLYETFSARPLIRLLQHVTNRACNFRMKHFYIFSVFTMTSISSNDFVNNSDDNCKSSTCIER
jgi:hypothetical protein